MLLILKRCIYFILGVWVFHKQVYMCFTYVQQPWMPWWQIPWNWNKMTVRHHVVTGKQTEVLCKSSKSSQLLSRLSRLFKSFF